MSPGVELARVSKTFAGHRAVDDVSFAVPEGSFFSLLGPSGCGKSTTLRMLSGFDDPDSGDIRIGGQLMNGIPAYHRPTNLVFQRWALFPHMTVFENVAFGPSLRRIGRAELKRMVGDAIELVGLEGHAERKPAKLSGGQMQRVALARALVNKPKVLLLDEPLGALDLRLRLQMQIELKRIQSNVGATFVYVTHDQGEALTMSDQIAIMNAGRIDQIGAPHSVYDAPRTRFVATFLGNANTLPVKVLAIEGEIANVELEGKRFPAVLGQCSGVGAGEVVIRHESIAIGTGLDDTAVQFDVRVRDVIFSGSTVSYIVRTADGLELTVETRREGDGATLLGGEATRIGWTDRAARLFSTA